MTTNNNRHHIHHHEHLDESEIYKRKNLSAAQRRKKLAKILFRVLCVIAVAITCLVILRIYSLSKHLSLRCRYN